MQISLYMEKKVAIMENIHESTGVQMEEVYG